MELYIRSQDKTNLILAKDIVVSDGNIKVYKDTELCTTVAMYKTKERALEILDEIQNILSCKCLLKSYDNLTPEFSDNVIIQPCEVHIEQLNDYVYTMPEE